VLRTTPLLPSIRNAYPQAHITWICGSSSFPLIHHNPQVDRTLPVTTESIVLLDHEHFHLVINFDLAPEATAIAGRVRANQYLGYGRKSDGSVVPFTPEGEEWLDMSLWDDFKKANTRTYQSHMRRLIRVPDVNYPIFVPLLPESELKAQQFAADRQLDPNRLTTGFNVGAGERWQHKKWTVEGYVKLAEYLHQQQNAQIVILYGADDRKRAREVMSALTVPFIDAGIHERILDFVAIMNLCDLVITGDTFALHAALGLGKRVVCLVGPTSATELEMYDQGVILQGDIDCLGCYLTRCDKDPYCMKLLNADTVYQAVCTQIEALG
jgi:ADP-heptose:LPS heptosyltransferase